jgi:hypothetical protein
MNHCWTGALKVALISFLYASKATAAEGLHEELARPVKRVAGVLAENNHKALALGAIRMPAVRKVLVTADELRAAVEKGLKEQSVAINKDATVKLTIDATGLVFDASNRLIRWKILFILFDTGRGRELEQVLYDMTRAQVLNRWQIRYENALGPPMHDLARELTKVLQKMGASALSLEHFSGPRLLQNVGMEKILGDALQQQRVRVVLTSAWSVRGEYSLGQEEGITTLTLKVRLVDGDGNDHKDFKFERTLKFGCSSGGDPGKPEEPRHRDPEGLRTLIIVAGVTGEFPTDESETAPHKHIASCRKDPKVWVDGKSTKIKPSATSKYAIEILVKKAARTPVVVDGQAFVKLERDDEYVVRIFNDSPYDAAVALSIDGLSMFAFSKNKEYVHVLVPRRSGREPGCVDIRGWHITNANTESFKVMNYGDTPAAQFIRSSPGSGAVTAVFSAAWAKGEKEPADEKQFKLRRSRGEPLATGRGRLLKQKYDEHERYIGAVRAAITVRYNRTEKGGK